MMKKILGIGLVIVIVGLGMIFTGISNVEAKTAAESKGKVRLSDGILKNNKLTRDCTNGAQNRLRGEDCPFGEDCPNDGDCEGTCQNLGEDNRYMNKSNGEGRTFDGQGKMGNHKMHGSGRHHM